MIELCYEEVSYHQSTLFNYYLMKYVHDFLYKQGKQLHIDRFSLRYDWSNGWGLPPFDLFEELLKSNFGATVNRYNQIEDGENFNKCFSKFHLGTLQENNEVIKIDFPNKFDKHFEKVEVNISDDCGYSYLYAEEESFFVAIDESTVYFSHCTDYEINYIGIFNYLFELFERNGNNEVTINHL